MNVYYQTLATCYLLLCSHEFHSYCKKIKKNTTTDNLPSIYLKIHDFCLVIHIWSGKNWVYFALYWNTTIMYMLGTGILYDFTFGHLLVMDTIVWLGAKQYRFCKWEIWDRWKGQKFKLHGQWIPYIVSIFSDSCGKKNKDKSRKTYICEYVKRKKLSSVPTSIVLGRMNMLYNALRRLWSKN